MIVIIEQRKWLWTGHMWKTPSHITRHALDWNVWGKRKTGCTTTTCRQSLNTEEQSECPGGKSNMQPRQK